MWACSCCIVLDEATAALDSASQARVMDVLLQELKDATVVSIGHRAELADFHDRKIILQRGHEGARLVSDLHLVRSAVRAGQLRGRAGFGQRPWPTLCIVDA